MAPPADPAPLNLAPAHRFPLLLLGFVALLSGAAAGLARLGWGLPGPAPWHGPLMVCGFFGVVIALERAVAIGRLWAYAAPLAAGLGTLLLLGGSPVSARLFLVAGAAGLLAASLLIVRRQPAAFTATIALGAAAFLAGNAAWAAGATVAQALPGWIAFLVLTIAGERLELSRFLPPSPRAAQVFQGLVALLLLGALLPAEPLGTRVFAAALLALAAWLVRQDIARRTVRGQGLTRYIAICLLSGYAWLAVGAAVLLVAGGFHPGTPAYDAALHALLLGFVFSMVFGHAPIIFPAILPVRMAWHPGFYAPLGLLHVSLAVRLAGDAAGLYEMTRIGGLLNALALVVFIANVIVSVVLGRARGAGR